jgi:hypothetical protein
MKLSVIISSATMCPELLIIVCENT